MIIQLITRLSMGGAQQMACNLANELNDSGEEVVVITGLSSERSSAGRNNILLSEVTDKGYPLEVIKSLTDNISILKDFISFVRLIILLRTYQAEAVHIHGSKVGILGRCAILFFPKTRAIFHVHGWSFSRSKRLSGRFYLLLEKALYYITDDYIFVCNQDIEDFIQLGGNKNIKQKSQVIYPGASFEGSSSLTPRRKNLRSMLNISENDHVIGNIARLDDQKDPLSFVEVAKELLSISNKNYKFLMIGSGSLENEVKSLVKFYNLEDNFIFTGFVNEVESYFKIFDAFVVCSKYEGLPITAVKALASKSPVFSFMINGMIDLSKLYTSVHLVNDRSTKEMALMIEKELNNTDLTNILEQESILVKKEFSFRNMFSKTKSIYFRNKINSIDYG